MESLRVITDLDEVGLQEGGYSITEHQGPLVIGAMKNGTASGRPVVMIALKIGRRRWLVVQTTLALFLSAADALKAAHGDPR